MWLKSVQPFSQYWGTYTYIHTYIHTRGLTESSRTVSVVNCLGEKIWGGGQGHTSSNLLQQSITWHHAVNTHCFYMSAFSTSCFPLAVMDGKIEQRVWMKFFVKLGKSATKPLKMLHEAFGEHSLSRTAIFHWHSCFTAGRMSVEDDEHSGRPSTSKTQKMLKYLRTHPRRMSLNNSWARKHCWDQLWSLPENPNRKF
jgi:hypothetical protein